MIIAAQHCLGYKPADPAGYPRSRTHRLYERNAVVTKHGHIGPLCTVCVTEKT